MSVEITRAEVIVKRRLALGIAALALAFFANSAPAYALSVDSVSYHGDADSVQCEPSGNMWDIALAFDENVSVVEDDAQIVENNLSCIHLQTEDGSAVDGWHAYNGGGNSERCAIYIGLDEPLQPSTRYRILVDSSLSAVNGEETLGSDYVTYFTTELATYVGLSSEQIACIVVAAVALTAGVVVAVFRRKQEKR